MFGLEVCVAAVLWPKWPGIARNGVRRSASDSGLARLQSSFACTVPSRPRLCLPSPRGRRSSCSMGAHQS
jgi:hypothetical protein